MKKLLVVLMAAVMVLSVAAVSMAATVEGDWRTEWTKEDKASNEDLKFYQSDLRINFKGKVSDTVDAYMQWSFGRITKDYGSSYSDQSTLKEWYVTLNQSWGKVMAGQWDYKLVPSRVLIKPHTSLNCVNPKSMQWAFDIPVGDAFNFGLWLVPDLSDDAMDYDVKFGYKADSFGAEVHYGQTDSSKDDATYTAFDVYYNINDSIKAFAYGVQKGDDITSTCKEDLDPIVGFTFKNIAGSQLTASLEYGVAKTIDPVSLEEYNKMAAQLKYSFTNKVSLEVEYTNYNKITKDDQNENKLVIRPRVKF